MMLRVVSLAFWGIATMGLQGVSFAQTTVQFDPSPFSLSAVDSLDGLQVPEFIAQQRQSLAMQRDAVLRADTKLQADCWQKFAVNACLIEARRVRRQALDPLTQRELVLNEQERLWKTEQREKRLQGKQFDNRDKP
jgi:hypothetical protein